MSQAAPAPKPKVAGTLLFGPVEVARSLERGSGFGPTQTPTDPRAWPLVFPDPTPQGATAREFRIELAARNGLVVRRLRLAPVGDRWETASRQFEGAGESGLAVHPEFKRLKDQPAEPIDDDPG